MSGMPKRQPRWKEDAYNLAMEVYRELEFAVEKFPPMRSAHEAYAIIHEETDELWDAVKGNKADGSLEAQRKEAIQVAAMAVRFVLDISDKGKHRNERVEETNEEFWERGRKLFGG